MRLTEPTSIFTNFKAVVFIRRRIMAMLVRKLSVKPSLAPRCITSFWGSAGLRVAKPCTPKATASSQPSTSSRAKPLMSRASRAGIFFSRFCSMELRTCSSM